MDRQLGKSHGRLFSYIITAVKLTYVKKMERFWNSHRGGMVGEADKSNKYGKINLFA